jgi:hypothetical protein
MISYLPAKDIQERMRKIFDIGRVPVCSKCGKSLLQCSPLITCCSDGTRITLREYVTIVRKEEFKPEEWSIKESNINCTHNININAEISLPPPEELKNDSTGC